MTAHFLKVSSRIIPFCVAVGTGGGTNSPSLVFFGSDCVRRWSSTIGLYLVFVAGLGANHVEILDGMLSNFLGIVGICNVL